jgi:hypothetical protein
MIFLNLKDLRFAFPSKISYVCTSYLAKGKSINIENMSHNSFPSSFSYEH